jgi:hypothetical protein
VILDASEGLAARQSRRGRARAVPPSRRPRRRPHREAAPSGRPAKRAPRTASRSGERLVRQPARRCRPRARRASRRSALPHGADVPRRPRAALREALHQHYGRGRRNAARSARDVPPAARRLQHGPRVPARVARANPALGRAGMRALLSRELVLRRQLQAILRAGREPPVRIALPFVTDAGELRRVKDSCSRNASSCASGRAHAESAASRRDRRDARGAARRARPRARGGFPAREPRRLTQHLLGADRDNLELKGWFEALHPCVLRALRTLVEVCAELGKPLGAFGVTATARQNLPFLVGVGLREFSAEPSDLRSIGNALDRIPTRTAQRAAQRARRQLVPGGDALARRGLEARLRAFLSLFQRASRSSTPLAGRTTCALAGGDAFPSSAFSAAATACTCASCADREQRGAAAGDRREPRSRVVRGLQRACTAGNVRKAMGDVQAILAAELEQLAVSAAQAFEQQRESPRVLDRVREARRCAARASARSSSRAASGHAITKRNDPCSAWRTTRVRSPATGSDSTQPPNSAAVTLSGWPSRASASSSNSSRLTVRGPALAPSTSPAMIAAPELPSPRRVGMALATSSSNAISFAAPEATSPRSKPRSSRFPGPGGQWRSSPDPRIRRLSAGPATTLARTFRNSSSASPAQSNPGPRLEVEQGTVRLAEAPGARVWVSHMIGARASASRVRAARGRRPTVLCGKFVEYPTAGG